jgi:hypothetical protein
MSEFISLKKITKTRKIHTCFACRGTIEKGQKAYAWTSVDEGIYTTYLHDTCGQGLENHCFGCDGCQDWDGFSEGFMYEAMLRGYDCAPCEKLRKEGVE